MQACEFLRNIKGFLRVFKTGHNYVCLRVKKTQTFFPMALFFSYNTEDPDCYRDLANIRYVVVSKIVSSVS